MFQDALKRANKNSHCETHINLEPPTEDRLPSMFHDEKYMGEVINFLFWVYFVIRLKTTVEMFLFKYYTKIFSFYLSRNPKLERRIRTVYKDLHIYSTFYILLTREIIIWKLLKPEFGELQIFCAYCNPCNPFQMITETTTLLKFKQTLQSINRQIKSIQLT